MSELTDLLDKLIAQRQARQRVVNRSIEQIAEEIEMLRTQNVKMVELLEEADRLYTNYALTANPGKANMDVGKWICDVRDLLRTLGRP